jgi:DNA polymerase, archaea type
MHMKIQFYPYDFDYKIQDGRVNVYMYGKHENGQKICVIIEHAPFFYADVERIDTEQFTKRIQDLKIDSQPEPAKVTGWEPVEQQFLGKKKNFWKIYTNFPKAVPTISKEIQKWGVECYEHNILFVHRFLRDTGIIPTTLVEAECELIKSPIRVPTYKASSVKDLGKEELQKWKILAIDIETYAETKEINPQKNPILMIAFYGVDEEEKEFKKVITWKKFPNNLDYLEYVSDEAVLLERTREIILNYNPDILTGYFSDGFDLPYIDVRADKHRVKMDLGMDHSNLFTGSSFKEGDAKIRGILHLDMLKFIKYIFGGNLKTDSYSLNAVSEELLGNKKHDVNLDKLAHIWDHQPEKLVDFCEYNLHDSHLTYQLCRNLLSDMIEFTKIVGLPPFDVTRMRFSRLVENYIMKRGMEYGIVAPNKPGKYELEQRMEERIQGAFVKEPIPGVYKNIGVFDFRSLYPTIITAHNIGPEGFQCDCCSSLERVPEREEYWFCQKEKKFLPMVLEELILRRVDIKRLINDAKQKGDGTKILEARSYALKILANSFYGYLGFFGARWYSLPSAASTTAYARDYIQETIKKAEARGFSIIYGDTDSMFLLLGDKILDEAFEFMNSVNFDLPGHMELEFEGQYVSGIFVAQKGSDKGAKKKYALLDAEGGVKITGFEVVRRNWSKVAKEVQKKVLDLVLRGKTDEAVVFVKQKVKELKEGSVDTSQVIIKTQITKDLSKYNSIGPHVAVALEMAAKGENVGPGTVVEYVVVRGSGLVRERARIASSIQKGEYDPAYYLNHQIIPAVMSIFEVLGLQEDEIFSDSSQKGLKGWF